MNRMPYGDMLDEEDLEMIEEMFASKRKGTTQIDYDQLAVTGLRILIGWEDYKWRHSLGYAVTRPFVWAFHFALFIIVIVFEVVTYPLYAVACFVWGATHAERIIALHEEREMCRQVFNRLPRAVKAGREMKKPIAVPTRAGAHFVLWGKGLFRHEPSGERQDVVEPVAEQTTE